MSNITKYQVAEAHHICRQHGCQCASLIGAAAEMEKKRDDALAALTALVKAGTLVVYGWPSDTGYGGLDFQGRDYHEALAEELLAEALEQARAALSTTQATEEGASTDATTQKAEALDGK